MTHAAGLVASLVASLGVLGACTTEGLRELPDSPTTPVAADPTSVVAGHPVIVATDGALAVAVPDLTAIGLAGAASEGYDVEPDTGSWPNWRAPAYRIRAYVAGAGSYEIATSKGIARGLVESADVAGVALVPAAYQLDGHSPFALAPDRPELEAALFDAAGRRLVDATLILTDETAPSTQPAWDRATLAPVLGRHTIVIAGDSIGEQRVAIDMIEAIDRVEEVRRGDRTCFHAYAGTTEVVTTMALEGGTPDPTASNCALSPSPADPLAAGAAR